MTLVADQPDTSAAPPGPKSLVLWVMRLAALVALLVCGYLSWIVLTAGGEVGCGGIFDCEAVLGSRWSKWLGLPVSLPAASLYATLLVTLSFAGPLSPPKVRAAAWNVSTWLAALAGVAALWFVSLQVFVIQSFCYWCVSVHVCGLGLALLALAEGKRLRPKLTAGVIAASGLAMLVGGQLLFPAPQSELSVERFAVEDRQPFPAGDDLQARGMSLADVYADLRKPHPTAGGDVAGDEANDNDEDEDEDNDEDGGAAKGASTPPADGRAEEGSQSGDDGVGQMESRLVPVLGGRAQVDVYQHPVLGSPDARRVVVKLFDYTCPHCQKMHGHLEAAREQFGDDFAVVLVPVPLRPRCNPYYHTLNPKHQAACELAELALAVWSADPLAFADFHQWLFASEDPPPVEEARAKAAALVGEEELARQMEDWRLQQRLSVGPHLYNICGRGAVPKLLLPPQILLRGGVHDRGNLLRLLSRELGFEEPSSASARDDETGDVLP